MPIWTRSWSTRPRRGEHQWYIAAAGFEIAVTWASAIAVERALASQGNGPVPAAELIRASLPAAAGARHAGAGPDPSAGHRRGSVGWVHRRGPGREFVASLPLDIRTLADAATVDGPQLFDMLRGIGAAGLVINAGSDDQTALTANIAEIIAARSAALIARARIASRLP